jgi:hypothetical protein
MKKIIKDTTEKLENGTITKDEADKILLDLFGVIRSFSKEEMRSAYNAGCPISWSDFGVTMEDDSFDDWFNKNYV